KKVADDQHPVKVERIGTRVSDAETRLGVEQKQILFQSREKLRDPTSHPCVHRDQRPVELLYSGRGQERIGCTRLTIVQMPIAPMGKGKPAPEIEHRGDVVGPGFCTHLIQVEQDLAADEKVVPQHPDSKRGDRSTKLLPAPGDFFRRGVRENPAHRLWQGEEVMCRGEDERLVNGKPRWCRASRPGHLRPELHPHAPDQLVGPFEVRHLSPHSTVLAYLGYDRTVKLQWESLSMRNAECGMGNRREWMPCGLPLFRTPHSEVFYKNSALRTPQS